MRRLFQSVPSINVLSNVRIVQACIRNPSQAEYFPASHTKCPLECEIWKGNRFVIQPESETYYVSFFGEYVVKETLRRKPFYWKSCSSLQPIVVNVVDISWKSKISYLNWKLRVNPANSEEMQCYYIGPFHQLFKLLVSARVWTNLKNVYKFSLALNIETFLKFVQNFALHCYLL